MSIKLQLPKLVDVKPRLTVIGVGGAGCNAVNNMIAAGLQGVEFVVANTDAQSLAASSAETRIQLGTNLTEGLGAGSRPEIGEAAAEEAMDEIRAHMVGSHMVFIAAGMGGGTGTGAATVIARAARELGILTVGIVCKPFQFEGARRMRIAEAGVQTLRHHVDTLIVIPNQNLFRIANERTTFAEAFVLADQVLYSGVACIVELVLKEGLINLDFADVRTVMSGMGTAMMGTGEATGDRRAILAAEEAIANPLLDDVTLKGAKGLLLSITGGRDLTLYEVDEAASRVRQEVDPEANIIVGATFDDQLGDRIRVSIVASGMGRLGEIADKPAVAAKIPPQQAQAFPFVPHPHPHPQHGYQGQPMQAAPHPDADMQRRLSDVLQASQPPMNDLQEQIRHARETWSAPGNVMIEEGLAHFQPIAQAGLARPAAAHNTPPPPPAQFQPAPPADIPRSARRMPNVDDFPAVGQKEWHAKQKGMADAAAERKSNGFFDRLTGRGKRAAAPAGAQSPSRGNPNHTDDTDVPLPILFGRDRR